MEAGGDRTLISAGLTPTRVSCMFKTVPSPEGKAIHQVIAHFTVISSSHEHVPF